MKGIELPLGGMLRRYRAALASWLALAVAATGIVVYAVSADGYQAHKTDLNDGGIWVTNNKLVDYGRVNKPIGKQDGAIHTAYGSNIDVVQDGASVVGIDLSESSVISLDPSVMLPVEGEQAAIPTSPAIGMAGGSLAVLDTTTGHLWATYEDPTTGVPAVAVLNAQNDPLAKVGEDAALAVAMTGTVFAVSAADGKLLTVRRDAITFAAPKLSALDGKFGDSIMLTAVGDQPIVLDSAAGRLVLPGGVEAEVPQDAVLQQPGPDSASVLLATADALLSVALTSGEVTIVAEVPDGSPANPVRLGDCVYGAWSGGTGSVVTRCGPDESGEPQIQSLDAQTADLVFRTNRGQIVLNDRTSGAVWDVDSDKPTRLDNWDAFKLESEDKDDDNQDDNTSDQGDRRPPKAKDDEFGARPARTTVLYPLDNDSAPSGRLLAIRTAKMVSGTDADLAVSPDGQTVQITLAADASGPVTFEYFIDDGRTEVSASARVRVNVVPDSAPNSAPALREGFESRVWTVPATGSIDVPVLSDWRDAGEGDPVSAVQALPLTSAQDGASARITGTGAVRFQAGSTGGLVKVEYAVTDGLGEPVTQTLDFQVQDPSDQSGVAPVAEPDVISGEVGKPITISPLLNDLPGSDPSTPDAILELAGRVGQLPGADITTNLVKGTITLRSDVARTFFLDYQAAYGLAENSDGKIRVDVQAPENPPQPPVAVPDAVTLYGQTPALVDVLANDLDPSGGLLAVQRADPVAANQLDVAVIEGRWLRISGRQGELTPNPTLVRYTISNGRKSGVQGQVVVSQRPMPEDNTPVTQADNATVRSGASVSVAVLGNDFNPAGGPLRMVADTSESRAGELDVNRTDAAKGATGTAYIAGNQVRFVAPAGLTEAQSVVVRYPVINEHNNTAVGKLRINVLPVDPDANTPPEPAVIEGRTVSGDTVKLRLPGSGVDPEGDPTTILGLSSAPTLGRAVRIGANSIQYQAYPASSGTDEFRYAVTDALGATSEGVVRVVVAPPGQPQPPMAVNDSITVEPGRTAVVDVLANDLVVAGSRVKVTLVDQPEGVTLRSDLGPIEVVAPAAGGDRTVQVTYEINDGLDQSQATLTLTTTKPYNNPPVVSDAFGVAGDGDSITVDVLSATDPETGQTGAYDPDGAFEDLKVTKVIAPAEVEWDINGSKITVVRNEHAMVLPFQVVDGDGGVATASVYVPAADSGLPFVSITEPIKLKAGDTLKDKLADMVTNPAGGPVQFTLRNRIWGSPRGNVNATITGESTFEITAARGYEGPGAVVFEVTTGKSPNDPQGVKATLSVPVQVGDTRPILRCPNTQLDVAQSETIRIDAGSVCHVFTVDPAQAETLAFTGELDGLVDGLTVGQADDGSILVTAAATAEAGTRADLLVRAGESDPGRIGIRVTATPPPSLARIPWPDMKAGSSRTLNLAPYLTSRLSDPDPTVVGVNKISGGDARIASSGSSITVTAGQQAKGRAEFEVVMSDVASGDERDRQVRGRIVVNFLGAPEQPATPSVDPKPQDGKTDLTWRAPEANGSRIEYYKVKDQNGRSWTCRQTQCSITGLTNGKPYRFAVQAHNGVGDSAWSGYSKEIIPAETPQMVGEIKLREAGDGYLKIYWTPLKVKYGTAPRYLVRWGDGKQMSVFDAEATISGLDNNTLYEFTVVPSGILFAGGGLRTAKPFQPIGTPPSPPAPSLTPQETAGAAGAVSLTWAAVDSNGPGPVRYTVYRDGAPLSQCTNLVQLGCVDTQLAYDGHTYQYAVAATNKGGKGNTSAPGATTPYSAVGKPAAWGAWTLAPTGQNAQAKATFTVPASRGGQSVVRVYVDGAAQTAQPATGNASLVFATPGNDGPHQVALEVCNEGGACSQSAPQAVQTYGPLVQAHIEAFDGIVSDDNTVVWRIRVNSNGDPATLTITSDRGRNETFQVGVGSFEFTTPPMQFGYRETETARATLSDASPNRGSVSVTNSVTTPEPPPPSVTISKGDACNDASSPVCATGVNDSACTDASCAKINLTLANVDSVTTCTFSASHGGQVSGGNAFGPYPNGANSTAAYFGSPGAWIQAHCRSAFGQQFESALFTW